MKKPTRATRRTPSIASRRRSRPRSLRRIDFAAPEPLPIGTQQMLMGLAAFQSAHPRP